MFGSMQSGASAYAKVGMETGVVAANPHQLIVMLFEGAQVALNHAAQHMKAGNVAEKGKSISKAIMIIENGLRASLDKTVGGEIALNLDALYEYMSSRLLIANIHSQLDVLEEVQALLQDIKGAWAGMLQPAAPATVASILQIPQAPPYDALAPRTPRLMKA